MSTQWIHWRKSFPEFPNEKNKLILVNNVVGDFQQFMYELELSLELLDESCPISDDVLLHSTSGFYQLHLNWKVETLKGMFQGKETINYFTWNCALKFRLNSLDGKDYYQKWIHVDLNESTKTMFKDFVPKATYRQLMLNCGNKRRKVSCEIVLLVRYHMKFPNGGCVSHGDEITMGVPPPMNVLPALRLNAREGEDVEIVFTIRGIPDAPIRANKFLLAASSPVLRKMLFETDMEEKATGCVQISGTTFFVLETFIGLMMGEIVTAELAAMAIEHLLDVFSLAHTYEAEGAMDICSMFIMLFYNEEIDQEGAYNLFKKGRLYGIPDFRSRSFYWIKWKCQFADEKEKLFTFLKDEATDMLEEWAYFST